MDQNGQKWVRVGFQRKWAFAPRSELVSTGSSFFQQLEPQDVAILDPKLQASIRRQAQDAVYEKQAYVIDRLGWHGDTYIRPDTTPPQFIDGVRVIDARQVSQADWKTGGSPEEWRAGIERFVAGQSLPTFVLGCAFASLIAHLVPESTTTWGSTFPTRAASEIQTPVVGLDGVWTTEAVSSELAHYRQRLGEDLSLARRLIPTFGRAEPVPRQ